MVVFQVCRQATTEGWIYPSAMSGQVNSECRIPREYFGGWTRLMTTFSGL